mmetsp:Transcript_80641/g.168135  ORF Transcript_80641/g.168135 Transcript_80641/m.168135 type:complete len:224 (-) Transcript_80641:660-1331(-)
MPCTNQLVVRVFSQSSPQMGQSPCNHPLCCSEHAFVCVASTDFDTMSRCIREHCSPIHGATNGQNNPLSGVVQHDDPRGLEGLLHPRGGHHVLLPDLREFSEFDEVLHVVPCPGMVSSSTTEKRSHAVEMALCHGCPIHGTSEFGSPRGVREHLPIGIREVLQIDGVACGLQGVLVHFVVLPHYTEGHGGVCHHAQYVAGVSFLEVCEEQLEEFRHRLSIRCV